LSRRHGSTTPQTTRDKFQIIAPIPGRDHGPNYTFLGLAAAPEQ
jgi:hypothetical protein